MLRKKGEKKIMAEVDIIKFIRNQMITRFLAKNFTTSEQRRKLTKSRNFIICSDSEPLSDHYEDTAV